MWMDEDCLDADIEGPGPSSLRRSHDERIVAGVCGGMARWLGLEPSFVRVAYVALSIFSATFPGLLVYAVLWFAIPEEPRSHRRATRRWRTLYRSEF